MFQIDILLHADIFEKNRNDIEFFCQRHSSTIAEILPHFEAAECSHKRKFAVKSIVKIFEGYF